LNVNWAPINATVFCRVIKIHLVLPQNSILTILPIVLPL
jgi:hypothetical protein